MDADYDPAIGITAKTGAYLEVGDPAAHTWAFLMSDVTSGSPSGALCFHHWFKSLGPTGSGSRYVSGYSGGGVAQYKGFNVNTNLVFMHAGYIPSGNTLTQVTVPGGLVPGMFSYNIGRDVLDGVNNRRRIYMNGALLIDENERDGGNTASTGHNEYFLGVNGSNAGASYADGVQYSMMAITSSLMSDAEQLDFYETVRDYLIIPTGRN